LRTDVKTNLLRESVYKSLRRDILDCRLPPGGELTEPALARLFRTSKSPVREALHRLERDRLVEIRPRHGYRVTQISVSGAKDLLEFRRLVEPYGAALAAESGAEEALRALDPYRSFEPNAYAGGFVEYNRKFHCTLARGCPNTRVAAATLAVIEEFDRIVQVSVGALARRDTGQLVAEHVAIIDALQRRNAGEAARLLRRHADAAMKRVLRALRQHALVP
jgi:DNA-binding GntR family transcriptional regulator